MNININNNDIGGANTNLKKSFETIGDILFQKKDPRNYVQTFKNLSPMFIGIVSKQLEHVTTRKVGEWLGLENSIDARQVIQELKRISNG